MRVAGFYPVRQAKRALPDQLSAAHLLSAQDTISGIQNDAVRETGGYGLTVCP